MHLVPTSQYLGLLAPTPGFIGVTGSVSPSISLTLLGVLGTLFCFLHSQHIVQDLVRLPSTLLLLLCTHTTLHALPNARLFCEIYSLSRTRFKIFIYYYYFTKSYTKKYILCLGTVHIYAKEIKISPNYIEPHYLWIHSDIF